MAESSPAASLLREGARHAQPARAAMIRRQTKQAISANSGPIG